MNDQKKQLDSKNIALTQDQRCSRADAYDFSHRPRTAKGAAESLYF